MLTTRRNRNKKKTLSRTARPQHPPGSPIRPLLLVVVLAAAGAVSVGYGQCNYSVLEVVGPGCPPFGTPTPLIATGLNGMGEVVGHYRDCSDNTLRYPFY
jgi:hypothetical protein